MLWIADNHHARKPASQIRRRPPHYVRAVARGRGRADLWTPPWSTGDPVLRFVEAECGVRFIFLDSYDYRQDLPGAVAGGQTVEPELFNSKVALGALTAHVRTDGRAPFTMQEYEKLGRLHQIPLGRPQPAPGRRARRQGRALDVHAAGEPGPRRRSPRHRRPRGAGCSPTAAG